jgi:hypothetical protein
MAGFTAADAVRRLADAIGRPIDAIVFNSAPPSSDVLQRYAQEHKAPLELGDLPDGCQLIEGAFWRHAIARHDRRRLRGALWALLVEELLGKKKDVSTSNVERRTSPVDKLGAT